MTIKAKPESVNILGVDYSITYHDNPVDVDLWKRKSLWGEIDHWTRTIRIYDNESQVQDIWHRLIHEILHGINSSLNLTHFSNEDAHDDLDVLALALRDVMFRNGWLEFVDS